MLNASKTWGENAFGRLERLKSAAALHLSSYLKSVACSLKPNTTPNSAFRRPTSAQSAPRVQIDRVGDEMHRAVAERGVHAVDMGGCEAMY